MKKAFILTLILVLGFNGCGVFKSSSGRILDRIGVTRGICAVVGDSECKLSLKLAIETDLLIYVQLPVWEEVEEARRIVEEAGFYGKRIFIDKGDVRKLHLADNLVDAVVVGKERMIPESEALRVLRPEGRALLGRRELIKPFPEGADDWSHPYHGPDNNPQSVDQIAHAPYLTQFLAEPFYAPLTQVAVASGGRVFKAFGNLAFHVREEALLNSLVAFNGFNGTMLWRRRLSPGVMIHRNTMIATPDILYVGDDRSCKLIDTATGHLMDEITPPVEVAGGTFWKWMALEDGILYALIGEQEFRDKVTRQRRRAHGWPWNPLSEGFNRPENPWGYGRNVLAIDPETEKVLWSHRESEKIDSRAMCMRSGRIYIFRFGSFLASLDARDGKEIWRRTPDNAPELFDALGTYLNRQDWVTNWRTTVYLKCSDKALYFAGPTIGKLLAVSAEDGSVLWENPYDNFQLVLRNDGLYGISGQLGNATSKKFDPLTGEVLAELETKRRACTRPNGSIDAIFFRALGGTVRLDIESNQPQWISPMRAQCHDGVTIANGLLYWWPSVCDCQNTLYGITCLGPAGDFEFNQQASEDERLEIGEGDLTEVESFPESVTDWPTFRANNKCNVTTDVSISDNYGRLWQYIPDTIFIPSAPVMAGGLVFLGGSDGIVRVLDAGTGEVKWKAYTGGIVRYPPTVWKGRVFVGSGDGWVYSYEAKTGRLLWRFRASPEERKIPVYGSLLSTWPVASNVLVEDGVAYLAAGIVNYDGIHVYALDAETGEIKWQNNTSGHLDAEAHTGVSVQGHMLLNDGKLYLAGGTSISPAVYDISDGKCLNDPRQLKQCISRSPRGSELYLIDDKVFARGKPLYTPLEYDVFDNSVFNKVFLSSSGNRDIVWLQSQTKKKVACYSQINRNLLSEIAANPWGKIKFNWRKFDAPDTPLWEYDCFGSIAMAVGKNAVVLAGESYDRTAMIEVLDIHDGTKLWEWSMSLESPPVPWGLAVDSDARLVIAPEDGKILCFGRRDSGMPLRKGLKIISSLPTAETTKNMLKNL